MNVKVNLSKNANILSFMSVNKCSAYVTTFNFITLHETFQDNFRLKYIEFRVFEFRI